MNIGILLNSNLTTKINYNFIVEASKRHNVVLIIKENQAPKKTSLNVLLYAAILKILSFVGQRKLYESLFSKVDLSEDVIIERVYVHCNYSKSGLYVSLDESEIRTLSSKGFDVLVRLDFSGILRGGILNLAPGGILSIHHGDNDWNRGGPPGFWEVVKKEPSIGYIIQKLSEELDGGGVLFKGFVKTHYSIANNKISLFLDSYYFLTKYINDEIKDLEIVKREFYDGPIYRHPNYYFLCFYLLFFLNQILKRLVFKEIWSVRFLDLSTSRNLRKSTEVKFSNGSEFIADPFLLTFNEKEFLVFEELVAPKTPAQIAFAERVDSQWVYRGELIKEDYHLSYPFPIVENRVVYMLPESKDSSSLILYKFESFPDVYNKIILLDNVRIVDCNIYKKDSRFYIEGTFDLGNNDFSWKKLRYVSDSIEGPYEFDDHLLDSDKFSNRNAGRYFDSLNVTQSHGFLTYGEFVTLSIGSFSERLAPNFSKDLKGLHHIDVKSDMMVFDVMEYKWKFIR